MSNPDLALAESVSTTNASYFIFVYILILIYCCFGLAVVCDVYFVPALQKLSYTYDLPPDIAGSTLMALGASVPELFASLIGVFVTEDDIGTGSIIGSSCFNLIAVPAACAFVASAAFTKKLTISPMPVIRNSAFYAITILVLLLIIKDNKVDILEAIILLLFFVMYMAFMVFSAQKQSKLHNNNINEKTPLLSALGHFEKALASHINVLMQDSDTLKNQIDQSDSVRLNLGLAIKNSTCLSSQSTVLNDDHYSDCEKLENHSENEDNWVSSKWILVPMFPLTLSMKVLTPCKFKSTCWTIWTFLVSIALIGGLTYISVWMVHLFGLSVGIPETISGMTILSWGTGIPELIASIVLIKKTSQADMAICNTIGSNVIDISFCLSLPWIVKCVLCKTNGFKPEVAIQSAALPWTSFLLLLAVLLLILVLKLHNWVLGMGVGVWLSVVYVTFVVAATYLEYSFSDSGLDLMSLL